MEQFLERLKTKVTVGLVGGSDLPKILEQLGGDEGNNDPLCFIKNLQI
jgi:hypothetical protein